MYYSVCVYMCNVHVYVYMYTKGKFPYSFAVFLEELENKTEFVLSTQDYTSLWQSPPNSWIPLDMCTFLAR